MDGWTDRLKDQRMDSRSYGLMDGRMDGQIEGQTDGWSDGWMDGWMDRPTDLYWPTDRSMSIDCNWPVLTLFDKVTDGEKSLL
jgi:hypothetical protein